MHFVDTKGKKKKHQLELEKIKKKKKKNSNANQAINPRYPADDMITSCKERETETPDTSDDDEPWDKSSPGYKQLSLAAN